MSGSISLSKETMLAMLAQSATFEAWVGAAGNAAAAAKRIYSRGLPPPANGRRYTLEEWAGLRPFCIVALPDREPYTALRGPGLAWGDKGRLELYFEAAIDADNAGNPATAEAVLTDVLGGIVLDLQALTTARTYLDLIEIDLALRPTRCTEKDAGSEGDHFFAVLSVNWSGGAEGGG